MGIGSLVGLLGLFERLPQKGCVLLGSQLALVSIFEFGESGKAQSVSLDDAVEVA